MIEDFLRSIGGQTGPEIAHADFRTLSLKRTCTNNDAALGGRKRLHRVEGVPDQIYQNLLNLDRGSFHTRQARIEVRNDGSFPDQNVGTYEPQGIGDYSVQVQRIPGALAFARHSSNSINHFSGTVTGRCNISQQLLQYRRVDLSPVEKTTSGCGVIRNSGERLIQFMRYRS